MIAADTATSSPGLSPRVQTLTSKSKVSPTSIRDGSGWKAII